MSDEDDDLDEDEDEGDEGDEDEDEGGDEDDFDEEGRGPPTAFDDDTEGRLVAGRCIDLGGMTTKRLTALKHAVDAIAERTKLKLDVVPGGDYTSTGPAPDAETYGCCVIGLRAGRGGTDSPDEISRSAALEQLAAAKKIDEAVWDEISALIPEKTREAFAEDEIELWLVCVGPLAAATLAFGIEGAKDAEGLPGKFNRGQNMSQEAFDTGVWGVRVGYVQYESPETEVVDLSDEAHAARVKELGRDDGKYYMVACYD